MSNNSNETKREQSDEASNVSEGVAVSGIDLGVPGVAAAAAAKNKIEEDYGYIIFESILNFLFPERFKNGVNGVLPNFNPTLEDTSVPFTSCFEDGSFVFNDPNAGLFKILLGANDRGDIDPSCRLNETKKWKHTSGTLDKLSLESHMLLNQLDGKASQEISKKWKVFQLTYDHKIIQAKSKKKAVYVKENEKILKKTKWSFVQRGISTSIYERYITSQNGGGIDAVCNPNNTAMPNTSFQKKGGKKLLKFYCLKFEKK